MQTTTATATATATDTDTDGTWFSPDGVVAHEPHMRVIDAHAKRDGGHNHLPGRQSGWGG